MIWNWWKARRRKRLLSQPFPPAWQVIIQQNCRHWATLTVDEQRRLQQDVQLLVAEKHWEGCQGLVIDDEMRVTVAAHAALMSLGFTQSPFDRLLSILIYPDTYVAQPTRRLPWGLEDSTGQPRLGEAWYQGPVILSWGEILRQIREPHPGRNLVIHEFSHLLDMANSDVDGIPSLSPEMQPQAWATAFEAEFEQLQRSIRFHRQSVLDDYAGTSRAEFFAVGSEAFFENGVLLKQERPVLYSLLERYYGQSPADRPLLPN